MLCMCVHADGRETGPMSEAALGADPKLTFSLRTDEFLVSVAGSSSGLYRGDNISFITSLDRIHTIAGNNGVSINANHPPII